MPITLDTAIRNTADFKTDFRFTDAETGDLIDFTGATIEIDIRDFNHCHRIKATTDNGKIAILDLGVFELLIPASEMRCLYPGSYRWGGTYSLNDETISLFVGSISVVDGIARI